jgi:hypothetical protein
MMVQELDELVLLERLKRLNPDEEKKIAEYRRLLDKILILTGFEFTATFGFHILGIFPPETPVRDLEFLLLQLNIPGDKLDHGATDVGATTDVLNTYRIINEAAGLSSPPMPIPHTAWHSRAQLRRADPDRLHPGSPSARAGSHRSGKTREKDNRSLLRRLEARYPRRMHCIQSSDAHRLTRDPANYKNLGLGDRVTEILLQNAVSMPSVRLS